MNWTCLFFLIAAEQNCRKKCIYRRAFIGEMAKKLILWELEGKRFSSKLWSCAVLRLDNNQFVACLVNRHVPFSQPTAPMIGFLNQTNAVTSRVEFQEFHVFRHKKNSSYVLFLLPLIFVRIKFRKLGFEFSGKCHLITSQSFSKNRIIES